MSERPPGPRTPAVPAGASHPSASAPGASGTSGAAGASPAELAARAASPAALAAALAARGYIVDDALAMTAFLALRMQRPLFLEGAPGVGKTLLASVLAEVFETRLIRLSCYEGLDLAQAAYEWNYPRQLLALQAHQRRPDAGAPGAAVNEAVNAAVNDAGVADAELGELYRDAFLMRRPLLQAIDAAAERPPVLLIDEIDRADDEFESFLLELLGEFQITIPELGTLRARHRPIVVLTSNRTRDVHDALKRRCLYHWIDYPAFATELEIVRRKVPALADQLRRRLVAFVQRLRREDLSKLPGVAETVDWAEAIAHIAGLAPGLAGAGAAAGGPGGALDPATVDATLGLLLKYHDDIERVRGALAAELLAESA
ncbi:MAG TPA: MoxR family ATPase [Kofleriaceae bacterium]|nr:MoxR family ATPase [Kofleriaceae bacterium]